MLWFFGFVFSLVKLKYEIRNNSQKTKLKAHNQKAKTKTKTQWNKFKNEKGK